MTVAEVAALLGTPAEIVTRWCVAGLIPEAKERDGAWRIPGRGLSFFCRRKLEPMYSIELAAAYLCKSPATIRSWIEDGSLAVFKTGPNQTDSVLIRESDLMRRIGL
jgi:predicted site-specific integrase-resolvase